MNIATLRRFLSRDRRRALRSLRESAKRDEARAASNAAWRRLAVHPDAMKLAREMAERARLAEMAVTR